MTDEERPTTGGARPTPGKGWVWRLGAIVALLGNIIGLPLRLFWQQYFIGVGVFCFIAGMIVGAISARIRAPRTRMITFITLPVFMIVAYSLFLHSVDQPEPSSGYSLSVRQFWEFFLYGAINFVWGLGAEVAARTTRSAGRE